MLTRKTRKNQFLYIFSAVFVCIFIYHGLARNIFFFVFQNYVINVINFIVKYQLVSLN